MTQRLPTFPPLLTGHAVEASRSPMAAACRRAARRQYGAGDIVWSRRSDVMSLALVLEPDVPRERCAEMLYTVMVAFGDAAGALVPPEIAITYSWPSDILMNQARVGSADLAVADEETDGVPDWLVVGLEVRILPAVNDPNPGERPEETTMWDEGCGEITALELIESVSRHILNAIHNWSEDGFAPVHEQYVGRLDEKTPLARGLPQAANLELIGLDEHGNALLSGDAGKTGLDTLDALAGLKQAREDTV